MISLERYKWVQWCEVFPCQYPCTTSFPGAFQLGIFRHCIFAISWLIWILHTIYILKLFHKVFQPLSLLVMFFLILRISLENFKQSSEFGIIQSPCFSLFSSLYTCFWLTWNIWFCLNCEILCFIFLTFDLFAMNLCFNSSITRFTPFFFTPYFTFSSLIFLFPFPRVSSCLPLSSLLISLLRLVISLSILLFHHGSFFLSSCLSSLQLLLQSKKLLS